MKRVLVDTSAWLALSDQDDQYHRRAMVIADTLKVARTGLLISPWVFAESLTVIRFRVNHAEARRFGQAILDSRVAEFAPFDDKVFRRAWEIFKKYDDKDFSFVDCTSFATMERLKLREAFAFDHHFEQYGFHLVGPT